LNLRRSGEFQRCGCLISERYTLHQLAEVVSEVPPGVRLSALMHVDAISHELRGFLRGVEVMRGRKAASA
jgi:hypothetical protein